MSDPQQLVMDTTAQVMRRLQAEREALRANPEGIYELVDDIVLPHFDFVSISRWVLGKHWRTASREQKKRFVKAFRTLLVRTYAVALLDYTDLEFSYLPLRDDPAGSEVTVRTQVKQASGAAVAIHYDLHRRSEAWKVYDITVEGVSLVANFRTSFASEIRETGLEQLIVRVEERARRESAQ
ncbi:MAG: ABC transporter substrate-binding protein [Pseudomonadota bacterium]|nr:MAG: ABC transporter substrate-binding protein [Pseudomonadota bacterium]